ncbi:hypothetical protein [Fimbriiglobus ruber]|uniref:Uncharacterized protein n=1 Tax=Fimbriiglobus ruber TaxID=1908690 RepID=A0A225DNQ1_9BACT|nr:hypothetical protein [Fimbriiglobus ruber]OWK37787.1 hypothetical protein FRUB_06907 [Fimbriiglobus ruber]
MRVRTLFLFLTGDRQAILDLAADRRAVWVGLLFVLSAGFAREYDGQDLLREPWHLLVPVGASLAAASVLFLVACGRLLFRPKKRPPLLTAYRSFLTLFWMTAPLAWLYAIPYERFLSPGSATSANLWTLALVAAWRVALMVRVVSVLTGRKTVSALVLVMTVADAAALTAVFLMPWPVLSGMGGVRQTESESAVSGATMTVACYGLFSAPFWFFCGLNAVLSEKPVWQVPYAPAEATVPTRAVWALAVLSLVIWLPILPWTQAEQQLRSQVERDMNSGRIAEGLDVLSAHAQSDFPPQWEPPPRIGYRASSPPILDVMDVLVVRECAPWVRQCYVNKFGRFVGGVTGFYFGPTRGDELARVVRLLELLPEGPAIVAEHAGRLESLLGRSNVSETTRVRLDALLKLAEVKAAKPGP